jgi:death-on-curing protein
LRSSVDQALAEAALAAPYSGVADREFFPNSHEKLAVLAYRLVRYHPFTDGNKRVAWLAMREMAARNGIEWSSPPGGDDEVVRVIEACAAGAMAEEDFIHWVGQPVNAERLKIFRYLDERVAVAAEHGVVLAFLEVDEDYVTDVGMHVITAGCEIARLTIGDETFFVPFHQLPEPLFRPDVVTGLAHDGEAARRVAEDAFERVPMRFETADKWLRMRFGTTTVRCTPEDFQHALAAAIADDVPAADSESDQ